MERERNEQIDSLFLWEFRASKVMLSDSLISFSSSKSPKSDNDLGSLRVAHLVRFGPKEKLKAKRILTELKPR